MSRLKNATEVTVLSVLVSHKNALSGCVKDGPFVMLQNIRVPFFWQIRSRQYFKRVRCLGHNHPVFCFMNRNTLEFNR